MPPIVLSIAGFDPSSGAGVTADLKTAASHGCYGVGCVTALTVQSTQGVRRMEAVSGELVRETLESLALDVDIAAIRIGMLGSAEVAEAVADFLTEKRLKNVVLDPVLASSSGAVLVDAAGLVVLKKRLLPLARVVTPNLSEAETLTGHPVTSLDEMASAAEALQKMGARDVLITGGHLPDNTDLLRTEDGQIHPIRGQKVESRSTHGTGCALAMAIACNLAQGLDTLAAATKAKEYVLKAIQAAYAVGKGHGPLNHLFNLKKS
jgi:hydroxymethylpyrimidine/phosphomethylpyrimidine kinase